MSWFVGYYYTIILIAALFLNNFLDKLDNKKYDLFLMTNFAFTQFGWTGGLADGLVPGFRTLLTGVFLYALGGYIRKYEPLSKLRTSVLFLAIFITYFFVNLSAYNHTENNIQKYFSYTIEGDFIQNVPEFPNYSIIVIILGICLFEIFRRIRIPSSKFINYLGQATLMVYLLHDNEFFYSIFDTQDWITLLHNYPYEFIVKIFIWSVDVFICGVVTYTFYIMLAKLFIKYKWVLFKK